MTNDAVSKFVGKVVKMQIYSDTLKGKISQKGRSFVIDSATHGEYQFNAESADSMTTATPFPAGTVTIIGEE